MSLHDEYMKRQSSLRVKKTRSRPVRAAVPKTTTPSNDIISVARQKQAGVWTVNPVNTEGVMGAGLAKQYKTSFPGHYDTYRNHVKSNPNWKGGEAMYDSANQIVAFPSKEKWRNPSKMEWIDKGFQDINSQAKARGIQQLVTPLPGTGLGGLNKQQVYDSAKKHLTDVPTRIVGSGSLNGALPRRTSGVEGTEKIFNKRLNIGFTGSRGVTELPSGLKQLFKDRAGTIIHGGAVGADTAVEKFAYTAGIPTKIHKPQYQDFPGREKYAPIARNKDIVADSDAVVGLWKPGSRGTTFTLNHALEQGKPTYYADMSKAEPSLIKLMEKL